MLALAAQWRVPVVLFAEGGGGRPDDTDTFTVSGLDTPSFLGFAAHSGLVPRVGIVSGRCFAGNATLLGTCEVIIATDDSNIGMGGPAMIQGGGLITFAPSSGCGAGAGGGEPGSGCEGGVDEGAHAAIGLSRG
jgi:acetyl-CoA carboxylase carboxyltransferase component